MGINRSTAEFLISGMKTGIVAGKVCTLGRLNLFLSVKQSLSLMKRYGVGSTSVRPAAKAQYYAEDLFEMLGFSDTCSIDVSDYEGASVIHDMNFPPPEALKESFDLVFDGGTLEHVFNYPTALKGAMEMVKVGGALIITTGTNNLCGHGFYQFSPELFFRALSPANGFRIVRIFVQAGDGRPYQVVDPIEVHGRVQLVNDAPTTIMVHAERTHLAEIFATPPQQSDYVSTWEEASQELDPAASDGRLKSALRKRLSREQVALISNALNRIRQKRAVRRFFRESRLSNRRLYRPVSNWSAP